MNKKFKALNIESILFFDIETVRREQSLTADHPLHSLFQWKMRDKVSDELPTDLETIDLYSKKGALYGIYNRIVCISVGFVKGGKVYIKSLTGEEEDIIKQFCEITSTFSILSGYNILYFDLPQILIAGSKYFDMSSALKDTFNPSGKKPWNLENSIIDLMDVFRGTGYINYSLEEVCYHFGVPTPKDDIKGSEVSEVFWNEKNGIDRISTYCNKDVFASINIFKAMRREEMFADFIDRGGKKVDFEGDMLQRLMKTQTIDDKFKAWLKGKLQEADENSINEIKDLVIAAYLIPKAKKGDNNAREKEIEELFTSLIQK